VISILYGITDVAAVDIGSRATKDQIVPSGRRSSPRTVPNAAQFTPLIVSVPPFARVVSVTVASTNFNRVPTISTVRSPDEFGKGSPNNVRVLPLTAVILRVPARPEIFTV
jgi:hypothetical protein